MYTYTTRVKTRITKLLEYQLTCNRHDERQALRFFTPGAICHVAGRVLAGSDALLHLHEFDRGCDGLIAFQHLQVKPTTISCLFVHETALDRQLGIPGLACWSLLTYKGDLIDRWEIEPPMPEEVARRRPYIEPVIAWARQHQPELAQRLCKGPGYDAGHALAELAARVVPQEQVG